MNLPGNILLIFFFILYSSDDFGPGKKMGQLENDEINEASGLVASVENPGILWTHNDSGNENRIFAIDTNGNDIATLVLEGIENRDWEDIAIGEDPIDKNTYLYIADIGDNDSEYNVKYIYRFVEPEITNTSLIIPSSEIETISFSYPDGPRDAETLLFDSYNADLFIVSKRDSLTRLYRLPYPQSTFGVISAELSGYLSFPHKTSENKPYNYITAGDISQDGREILLKSYQNVYYWEREINVSLYETLQQTPNELTYIVEPQGEAICWENQNGNGFFTVSEEGFEIDGTVFTVEAELYYYERNSTTDVNNKSVLNKLILEQNYPNPFNPKTEIKFSVPEYLSNQRVQLVVYDISGKEIIKLVDGIKSSGIYKVEFISTNYSSGVYFYRLQINSFSVTKKMIVLK